MTEPRSKWHKPNWLGKPAVEMRADEAAYQDTQPIVTTCLFCRWHYTGTVAEGRAKAKAHREQKHPEACVLKPRRRGLIRKASNRTAAEEAQIAVDAAESRRLRYERELNDMLVKVERGRRRGAAS